MGENVDPHRFREGVSAYYASLASSRNPQEDPIAAQFIRTSAEEQILPYESTDPLQDAAYMPVPRLVHRYTNRVLLLVNESCATYCRHCFRRHFTGSTNGAISSGQLTAAANYIRADPGIKEVLLSGGDPLMLEDTRIRDILEIIGGALQDRNFVFRVATRIPVVLPSRITDGLASLLRQHGKGHLWVVTQANHPREVSASFAEAVQHLSDHGVPVLNQSVLLRGVNNKVEVLAALCEKLIHCRVKPYYLLQGDLAAGTSHFRTSIEEGLALMDALRMQLSGIAMPTYAVDLPDGGGKIPLTRATVVGVEKEWYILRDLEGKHHRYPCER